MSAQFTVGDFVRVRSIFPLGHVRTPFYTRGCKGIVHAITGAFLNPEELAYGRSGEPRLLLYRVLFSSSDLWPGKGERAGDSVVVDIFEHWLKPLES